MINILEGTIEDLDRITTLFDQYMMFYEKESNISAHRAYLKDRIEKNEAKLFIAEKNNQAVGFVLNYFSFSSVSLGRIVVLNDLFVIAEARKQGVAGLLIKKVLELAQNTGAVRVDLGTAKTNETAQRLYEKIGFIKDNEYYSYSYSV